MGVIEVNFFDWVDSLGDGSQAYTTYVLESSILLQPLK